MPATIPPIQEWEAELFKKLPAFRKGSIREETVRLLVDAAYPALLAVKDAQGKRHGGMVYCVTGRARDHAARAVVRSQLGVLANLIHAIAVTLLAACMEQPPALAMPEAKLRAKLREAQKIFIVIRRGMASLTPSSVRTLKARVVDYLNRLIFNAANFETWKALNRDGGTPSDKARSVLMPNGRLSFWKNIPKYLKPDS